MECIFCKVAKGEVPSDILYQDEEVLAFRDINPQAPHHVLIIPRRHIATVNDLADPDASLIGRMYLAARQIAAELGASEEGYRLVMNTNRMAGQSVYHIHLHLLAGRPLRWPPG